MKELIGGETKKIFITKLNGKHMKIFPVGTPQSTNFKNVRSEFSTSDWDIIRKKIYRQANYRCEICDQSGINQGYKWPVECHEIWDLNFETEVQMLVGFIALCPRCHKIVHCSLTDLLHQQGKISEKEYTAIGQHFMDVNGITAFIDDAVQSNRRFHMAKHKINWTVDTSYAVDFLNNKN